MPRYVDSALTNKTPPVDARRPTSFQPPVDGKASNVEKQIDPSPKPAPEAPKQPSLDHLPSKVRLTHNYGYWFDDNGQSRLKHWAAGQIVSVREEIADLLERGAQVVAVKDE